MATVDGSSAINGHLTSAGPSESFPWDHPGTRTETDGLSLGPGPKPSACGSPEPTTWDRGSADSNRSRDGTADFQPGPNILRA